MFSSSSISINPFQFTNNQTIVTSSFNTTQKPISSIHDYQDPPSSSLFELPSTPLIFFDNDDNNFLFTDNNFTTHQNQNPPPSTPTPTPTPQVLVPPTPSKVMKPNTTESNKAKNKKQKSSNAVNVKRRSGKTDRHSKIYTAKGPRDRRMRLSLQIARKFFDLQDMLGFDKASKTIEWLFSKSMDAIKEVIEISSVCNSTSDSEVVSSGSEFTEENKEINVGMVTENYEPSVKVSKVKRVIKEHKKLVINDVVKELRQKARARARERTREKNKSKSQPNPKDIELLGGDCSHGRTQERDLIAMNHQVVGGVEEEPRSHLIQNDHILRFGSSSIVDFSSGVAIPSDQANFEDDFLGFQSEAMRVLTGNFYHVQNPNAINFTANINPQEQNPNSNLENSNFTSTFMTQLNDSREENPNSLFMSISNSDYEQNPSSIQIQNSYFLENCNQFSCSPVVANK